MDRRKFLKLASFGGLAALGLSGATPQIGAARESCNYEEPPMYKPVIGVSAYPGAADLDLMKKAGIGWIRHLLPYPFQKGASGPLREAYLAAKAQGEAWHRGGMEILGVTPLLCEVWPPDQKGMSLFECGQAGSEEALKSYQAACAFQAEDLRGTVRAWQVANEVDLPGFMGAFNLREACEVVLHGARGLKQSEPTVLVGTNSAAFSNAYYLFGYLYGRPYEGETGSPFDYCGDDGYYGTFQPGGPERWVERIAELHMLTGMKVMVNEWGFHSDGHVMTATELASGAHRACELKKLPYSWGGGHTPEVQAEYITAAFKAFRSQRDKLLGVIFYNWQDEERCRYCGSPDCPVTSRQGLVDVEGMPKPGYHAFREAVAAFVSREPVRM